MNSFPDPKVAFVTGAAQGLGLGIVQHLLSTGWKVMLFDLDADAGDEAITALPEEHQARALLTDWSIMPVLPIRIRDRSNIWIGKAGNG